MKKIIVSVMTVFSASFSYAISPYDVCNGLSESSSSTRCAQFVSQRQYFDQKALHICGSSINDSFTIRCMNVIANKVYDPQAIQICKRTISDSSIIKCMDVIANKVYDHQEIQLCNRTISDSDTIECMSQLSGRTDHYDNGSCRN